uniref:Uncharacterized protein n=1 Tax=Picea glauca TaxID=3330 RepID=A0A124GMP6_PICGL|nr:hypothetical protein ABT39_MTgene1832 [Picea glauca]QHR91809.1 hypothetical protein Q903MT_gene5845 [Picea sitchensis]
MRAAGQTHPTASCSMVSVWRGSCPMSGPLARACLCQLRCSLFLVVILPLLVKYPFRCLVLWCSLLDPDDQALILRL